MAVPVTSGKKKSRLGGAISLVKLYLKARREKWLEQAGEVAGELAAAAMAAGCPANTPDGKKAADERLARAARAFHDMAEHTIPEIFEAVGGPRHEVRN